MTALEQQKLLIERLYREHRMYTTYAAQRSPECRALEVRIREAVDQHTALQIAANMRKE